MHVVQVRRLRAAVFTAVCMAALATAASPASAATEAEAVQAESATKNRLIEQAKTKLTTFGGFLRFDSADGTDVPPGEPFLARVKHDFQNTDALSGDVFIDAAEKAGRLPVTLGVTLTAKNAATGVALDGSQAVSTGVAGFADRKNVLFRPRMFQSNLTEPDALQRALDARVNMTVDLPPLGQLVSSMASELGLPAPDTTQELVAFVFDRLTPTGVGRGDGLCRYLPLTHPAFCLSVPTIGDPDPLHENLFQRLSGVDVKPSESETTRNLLTVVDVEALPIPSVSAWFRHRDFITIDPINHPQTLTDCPDGFALLVVPPGTPGVSAGPGFGELSDTLNDTRGTLNKLTSLVGMTKLPAALKTLINTVDAYNGAGVRVWDQAAPNLNTEDFEMVGEGNCTAVNDIEADREISSAIAFGLPGSRWNGYDQFDFLGNSMALAPDADDWLVLKPNLRFSDLFEDKIRSLRLEANANTQ